MKKLIIIALTLFLIACELPDNRMKEYSFYVTYFDGSKDTLKIRDQGVNKFSLKEGDIIYSYNGKVVASGVRHFKADFKVIQ